VQKSQSAGTSCGFCRRQRRRYCTGPRRSRSQGRTVDVGIECGRFPPIFTTETVETGSQPRQSLEIAESNGPCRDLALMLLFAARQSHSVSFAGYFGNALEDHWVASTGVSVPKRGRSVDRRLVEGRLPDHLRYARHSPPSLRDRGTSISGLPRRARRSASCRSGRAYRPVVQRS
jgi:hypothetical protein